MTDRPRSLAPNPGAPRALAPSAANDSTPGPVKPGARCPICRRPTEAQFRPFCSRRCADVDLSRWLKGAYAVPGRADTDEDGDDAAASTGVVRQAPETDPDDSDDV